MLLNEFPNLLIFYDNDMNFTPEWISYDSTNAFSTLANDYLNQHPSLQRFFEYSPNLQGIARAIEARKTFPANRKTLVTALEQQYEQITATEKVKSNIKKLADANTFTICTAHQPNLFTGYLYFIYKIIHAIKLADELKSTFPEYHFVPVYYMGSEDNDLQELNHIYLNGDTVTWKTNQTGAVGRMQPRGIDGVIDSIEGQLNIFEEGERLTGLLRDCYLKSASVQEATFKLVNALFERYGLVVLIADNEALKKEMRKVFEDDLFHHTPATIVQQTAEELSKQYHAQVNPRNINLFYMKDAVRERIVQEGEGFGVNNTDIVFSLSEMRDELEQHPERFSPNVVLRGLYQETILPNIVFIGGGSEIAYWLELKDMFAYYHAPFPVLLLRNSFLIVEKKMAELMKKLQLSVADVFKDQSLLLNEMVKSQSNLQLTLEKERGQLGEVYNRVREVTRHIDSTLAGHVNALETKAGKALKNLEKKMIRAEKKKYTIQSAQLEKLKLGLFPRNTLQERVENILPYYARYGQSFIDMLYKHSPALGKEFGVLMKDC